MICIHRLKAKLMLTIQMKRTKIRCIEAGMSAKVLQTLLGHTDIKVTMNTYCDAFEQFQANDITKYLDYKQGLGINVKTA